jgi:hypothetical protein
MQAAIDLAWVGLFGILCFMFYFSPDQRTEIYATAGTLAGPAWRILRRA